MSRSNPNENAVNPCKHWFQWDGGDGKGFKAYDKENKKNVITPLPFKFLILDRLTTVTGFNEPENIGYYSNEIRNIKEDILTVRSKNGIEAKGTWEQVKAQLGSKGASFAQSVYIMFYQGKEAVLGNIKMSGAAIENWFAFCKENKIMEIGVNVKSANPKKKGKVEYFEPVFEAIKVSEASNNAAVEMDKELQAYLVEYLEKNKTSVDAFETKSEPKADQPKHEVVKQESEKEPDIVKGTFVGSADDDDGLPF